MSRLDGLLLRLDTAGESSFLLSVMASYVSEKAVAEDVAERGDGVIGVVGGVE